MNSDNVGAVSRSVPRIAAHTHRLSLVAEEVCQRHGTPARVSELPSEPKTVPVA